jgi:hypothetical protein
MLFVLIVIPCCLVGLLVYAAMSRWEVTSQPYSAPRGGGQPVRHSLPPLTLRDTVADWPIPQLQRLHPSVLVGISVVLGLWIVAWVVVFFVGLSMLHA